MKTTIYIKHTALICLCFLVFFSCNYKPNVVRDKKKDKKLDVSEHCITFTYEIADVNNKQQGLLSINGQRFSQIFIFVQDNDYAYFFAYDFKKSSVLGYNRTKKTALKNSDTKITDDELSRGWYLGSNIKDNTPDCWIFAQWNGGSAFIDPKNINDIISNEPFISIFPLSIKNKNLY